MGAIDFEDLKRHVGHKITCVTYGNPAENVSVECEDCSEVIISFSRDDEE